MTNIDKQFNSMPSDFDNLATGEHTGNYVGYYVIEDVTFTSFTPLEKSAKTESETILAGSTIPVPFTACTISGGKIKAYIG